MSHVSRPAAGEASGGSAGPDCVGQPTGNTRTEPVHEVRLWQPAGQLLAGRVRAASARSVPMALIRSIQP
jgi:hypothetical protein